VSAVIHHLNRIDQQCCLLSLFYHTSHAGTRERKGETKSTIVKATFFRFLMARTHTGMPPGKESAAPLYTRGMPVNGCLSRIHQHVASYHYSTMPQPTLHGKKYSEMQKNRKKCVSENT
jgi:hypothetical protein